MGKITKQDILKELLQFNTPTVGNVVATYPDHPNCLALYDNWYGRWYTSQKIKCMFPEKGPRIGYAFTLIFSLPDPNQKTLSFIDLIEALSLAKKPIIIVAQQKFPDDITDSVGLFGGQMTAMLQASGVVGVVTDGPSRDLDEMKQLDIQYIMSGATPCHGSLAIKKINSPVSIAGMDVNPGEIIHMDEHGAIKFPENKLEEVYNNITKFAGLEDKQAKELLNAKNTEEIKKAWLNRYK